MASRIDIAGDNVEIITWSSCYRGLIMVEVDTKGDDQNPML